MSDVARDVVVAVCIVFILLAFIGNYTREYNKAVAAQEAAKAALVVQHPSWPWALINEQKIRLGMTKEMVLASWGEPNDINRSVGSWGVHEQWVYRTGDYSANYLYFEDGILTSWSD